MTEEIRIDPFGFREYDARWLYEKDINLEGMTNLGKGFGSQIIKHTNWKPKISIEKGLDSTINWFKENKDFFKHDIYYI